MHTVLETPSFAKSAQNQSLTEDERYEIASAIAQDPMMGDLIKGTGGARKVRFGGKGKGKSSSFRVVTYFAGQDIPVFLLDLYSKSEKINLSQAERNELKNILGRVAEDYRKSMKTKVAKIRKVAS